MWYKVVHLVGLGWFWFWLFHLPDATPKELYFRLHLEPTAEENSRAALRKRRGCKRERIAGAVLGTDLGAAQRAIGRKRWGPPNLTYPICDRNASKIISQINRSCEAILLWTVNVSEKGNFSNQRFIWYCLRWTVIWEMIFFGVQLEG